MSNCGIAETEDVRVDELIVGDASKTVVRQCVSLAIDDFSGY